MEEINGNLQRQADEVEALQSMFAGDNEFELLTAHPAELMLGECLRMKIRPPFVAVECYVVVTLPAGYPSDMGPMFQVEGLTRSQAANVTARLDSFAAERNGEECIYNVVQALNEEDVQIECAAPMHVVASKADEQSGWCRMIFKIDHMNNPKGYTQMLKGWATEGCIAARLFFRVDAHGRYRNVYCIIDGDKVEVSAYMKKFRTQNVDVDGSGKACKERCAEVLDQLMFDEHKEHETSFVCVEYRAMEEIEHHLAAARVGNRHAVMPSSPAASPVGTGVAASWATTAGGSGRNSALLTVHVRPGRNTTDFTNLAEMRSGLASRICVDLNAQPREGEANEELVRLVARTLKVPVAGVSVVSGAKSKSKVVRVDDMPPDEAATRLLAL